MLPITHLVRLGVLALSLAAAASLTLASGRNLAPDALTRATTWNDHSGQVEWLTDGLVPPDSTARAFDWNTKGILAFEWEGVEPIAAVRLRVGSVANDYQVRTYVGGHLQDEGATRDPEGEMTARVDDRTRIADGWQAIELPAGSRADNIELRTLGPVRLYEVEILTTQGTAVSAATWARVKRAADAR